MRRLLLVWRHAAALVLGLAALAPAARAGSLPLAAWEAQALDQALARRLAQAELEQRLHQREAAQALDGARLQAGAGLARAREALTDTTVRRYERGQVQLGVRWPLLGSRLAAQRALDEADTAVAAARLREQDARQAVRTEVRRAYVALAAAQAREAAARAWLAQREALQAGLDRRRDAGLLLGADRLAYQTQVDTVERDLARQQLAQRLAWRELTLRAGLEGQAPPAVPWPQWSTSCFDPERLAGAAAEALPVALARLEGQAAQQEARRLRWDGVEAGVSLSHGLSRDLGGPAGYGTAIGVDLSVPLQWRRWHDARQAQARSRAAQAQALVALREQEQRLAIAQALDERELRGQERSTYARRLEAALQGARVASLRAHALQEGDGYERAAQARYALYQTLVDHLDARERAALADVQVLALAGECDAAAAPDENLETQALAALSQELAADAVAPAPAAGPMGWYVWQAQALLDDPSRLDRLPAGTGRVLLSFDAAQLERLTLDPSAHQRLLDLLARLRARGWRAEWLLGEPTWVLPQHRGDLLARLAAWRALPFDAVHLDLERSQLPPQHQRRWARDLLDTVSAVRRTVDWPIVLTTHPRELTEARLGRRLREAGVDEVVAMVYVTHPQRALQRARQVLDAAPEGLTVSLAWSIEPTLDAAHSHFHRGRTAALAQWQAWHEALSGHPRYGGWLVQSLETYLDAPP